MKCPKCGYDKTKTVWVRHKEKFTSRARECPKCGKRFQTKEMVSNEWDYKAIVLEIKELLRTVR